MSIQTLSAMLGYPFIVPDAPATRRHLTEGGGWGGGRFVPKQENKRTGRKLLHNQAAIEAKLKFHKRVVEYIERHGEADALEIAAKFKRSRCNAQSTLKELYVQNKIDRAVRKNEYTRFYVYIPVKHAS